MTDQEPYSNREIDSYFHNQAEIMHSALAPVKQQLDRIEGQTTKTNGRVNRLEAWRTGLAYAWTVVVGIVIPLIIYSMSSELKHIRELIEVIK